MKINNLNSSEFVPFHCRKQNVLIYFEQLEQIVTNYVELGKVKGT